MHPSDVHAIPRAARPACSEGQVLKGTLPPPAGRCGLRTCAVVVLLGARFLAVVAHVGGWSAVAHVNVQEEQSAGRSGVCSEAVRAALALCAGRARGGGVDEPEQRHPPGGAAAAHVPAT